MESSRITERGPSEDYSVASTLLLYVMYGVVWAGMLVNLFGLRRNALE